MQATTASGTHFTLPTRSERILDSQDGVVGVSQPAPVDSCDTLPPSHAAPGLENVLPSHATHIVDSGESNHHLDHVSTEAPSQPDADLLCDIHERDSVLNAGMNAIQDSFKDHESVLPSLQLPSTALQTYPSRADTTYPPENAKAVSTAHKPSIESDLTLLPEHVEAAQEDGDNKGNVAILQELAPYRMAVMGLRSEAQQQGKELRRLHQQFLDETSAIVDALEHRMTGDLSADSNSLMVQVAALSSLRLNVESARRVFHRSQEQLLSKEWKLKEEEDRLYNRYTGKQAASVLSDDLSENHSDLPSISPSVSLDEQSAIPEDLDRPAAPVQTEDYVEDAGLEFSSQVRDHVKRALLSAPALVNLGFVASASPPFNSGLASESSERKRTGQISPASRALGNSGMLPPPVDERVAQPSKALRPRSLTLLGSQFDPQIEFSIHADQPGPIELTSDNSSASDYSLPKLSRWFAFGVPWSSFTRGRRHRPYRLPDGVSPWQAMTINHYGAAALGVPISGQLDLLVNDDTRQSTTRRSLLQSWFWDPKTRSDHASASDGEPEKDFSEVTSARKTPVAATMPRLGGSLSPTVLLEDGGNSSAIVDGRSRFTAAAHRAQSDIAIYKRPSQRRKAK